MDQHIATVRLELEQATMTERANAAQIVDQGTYDLAVDLIRGVKLLQREAEEHHRPAIQKAHATWKETLAMLARIADPLTKAEATLNRKIAAWDQEQRRRHIDAIRQAAETARREREESAFAAALEAEQEGASAEEVEAVLEQEAAVPVVSPPPPEPIYQAAKGISVRKRYKVAVTDGRRLIVSALARQPQLVRDHGRHIGIALADLNRLASMQGGRLNLDGVTVTEISNVAVNTLREDRTCQKR